MRLAASLVVQNELDRYLPLVADHLATFCDVICVLDDGSTDGSGDWLEEHGAKVMRQPSPTFYSHEGRTRDVLLSWTLSHNPTHVLSIDADEIVSDGQRLRDAIDNHDCPTYELSIAEVWKCDKNALWTREDGGWREHRVPFVWKAPEQRTVEWWMRDAALACGRVPGMVETYEQMNCIEPTGVTLYHFGWARQAERERRYARYVQHDGGRFHSQGHLNSIMWSDDRVLLQEQPWPAGIGPRVRAKLAAAAARA